MIRILTGLCFATLMVLTAPSAFAHPDARHSLEVIDEHLQASPADALLYLNKAEILLGIDHLPEAIRCVDEAARLDPNAAGLGYYEARLFLAAGSPASAIKRLEAFLKTEPQHGDAMRLIANVYASQDDLDSGVKWLQAVLQLPTPPRPDDAARCASLYLHRKRPGDDDLALKALDTGLARIGCLTGLQYMAIDIEVRLGRHDAALARLALLSARFRPRVEFELRRAEILTQADRKAEAAAAYDNVVTIMDTTPRERQTSAVFKETRQRYLALRDELKTP